MHLPAHGANPNQLYERLAVKQPETWIDFSENTNPYGIPSFLTEEWEKYQTLIGGYPEPHSETLVEALAKQHQVKKEHVLVGNGATECIYLLAHSFSRKKVLIVEPTFTEYKKALEQYDCQVDAFVLREEEGFQCAFDKLAKSAEEYDVVFICNPNNPTGVLYEFHSFLEFIQKMNEQKKYIVIDEAFIDFVQNGTSMISFCHFFNYLIILRSLTKIFHLAGVRIGYLVSTNLQTIAHIKQWQQPWSVNALAQQLALRCLDQSSFIHHIQDCIAQERLKMTSFLTEYHYPFIPSETNFLLIKSPPGQSTESLFYFLLKEGIVPRHTYNFQTLQGEYLRIAIKRPEENEQLKSALRSFIS
ncbi:threonine-phosphate decarboxylase CobD [Massilibacterium senegalense]|uniref:threonine-phosphate decarboxylase CobD n=1 Tax=Massilibacterium senegalense TaxID=1632858 RepID=UPI0007852DF5|nr:threonine-phosphate decarboxylase CobD [Massilibacterium senegalense]